MLHFSPAIEQTGEGGWIVGLNPVVEFVSVRCYLDWCIGPDSPIPSDLRTYDVVTLCGLIKLLGRLAQKNNEIHQRVLKRIAREVNDLATGRRIIVSHRLPWRILPPGKTGIRRIINNFRWRQQLLPEYRVDENRLKFMEGFSADETFEGQDSFEGYICFHFSKQKLAVLECPVYGNALYILKHDWQALSRLTKTELLTDFKDSIRTVDHTRHFENNLVYELSLIGIKMEWG
jgi:hypothetical protein